MALLDRFRLEDKVAIVTGAGRGIGRGIALAFAEMGAHVVCAARTPAEIEKTAASVKQLGRRPHMLAREGGAILNISSAAGHIVRKNFVGRKRGFLVGFGSVGYRALRQPGPLSRLSACRTTS